MFKHLSFLFILFVMISCSKSNRDLSIKKINNEENITIIESEDLAMIQAIDSARNSFDQFLSILKTDTINQYYIKVGLAYEGGKEHIWLSEIKIDQSKLYGKVDNSPIYVKDVKYLDYVEITTNIISDWMIINDNKLIAGGFTLKALRNKMSEEEKQNFDLENGIIY